MGEVHQLPLALPPRATADILQDRLAAAVEEFNATHGDPVHRVELHEEIVRLRRLLMPRRGSEVHRG